MLSSRKRPSVGADTVAATSAQPRRTRSRTASANGAIAPIAGEFGSGRVKGDRHRCPVTEGQSSVERLPVRQAVAQEQAAQTFPEVLRAPAFARTVRNRRQQRSCVWPMSNASSIQSGKHRRQVLPVVAEVVLGLVALVLQGVECLVLDPPSCASGAHHLHGVPLVDPQVRDPREVPLPAVPAPFPVLKEIHFPLLKKCASFSGAPFSQRHRRRTPPSTVSTAPLLRSGHRWRALRLVHSPEQGLVVARLRTQHEAHVQLLEQPHVRPVRLQAVLDHEQRQVRIAPSAAPSQDVSTRCVRSRSSPRRPTSGPAPAESAGLPPARSDEPALHAALGESISSCRPCGASRSTTRRAPSSTRRAPRRPPTADSDRPAGRTPAGPRRAEPARTGAGTQDAASLDPTRPHTPAAGCPTAPGRSRTGCAGSPAAAPCAFWSNFGSDGYFSAKTARPDIRPSAKFRPGSPRRPRSARSRAVSVPAAPACTACRETPPYVPFIALRSWHRPDDPRKRLESLREAIFYYLQPPVPRPLFFREWELLYVGVD